MILPNQQNKIMTTKIFGLNVKKAKVKCPYLPIPTAFLHNMYANFPTPKNVKPVLSFVTAGQFARICHVTFLHIFFLKSAVVQNRTPPIYLAG